MKIFKKTISLVLTLSLVLSMGIFPANAAENRLSLSIGSATATCTQETEGTATVNLTILGNTEDLNLGALTAYIYYDSTIMSCTKMIAHSNVFSKCGEIKVNRNPTDLEKDEAHKDSKWKILPVSIMHGTESDPETGDEKSVPITGNGAFVEIGFKTEKNLESCETPLEVVIIAASKVDKTVLTDSITVVNGKISITGVTPQINAVTLSGNDLTDNKVTVNATDNVSLTAAATSAKGTVITDKVTWSVSPANQGVTINATTGAITVGAKATAGEYTVTAGAKGNATTGSATQKFTVEHAASVATTIDIYKDGVKLTPAANGSITDTAVIPVAGAANNECTYTAKVLDQFGDVMKNADQTDVTAQITVGTLPTGEGTSFTPADGKLTVAAGTATSDGVKFTATYSGKTQEFTVKFVAIEVQNWPGKTLEEGEAKSFVYGTSNGSIIGSFTAAGKALVGSDELAGTFAVTDADKYLPVGTGKTVAVTFTVDATKHPAYPNTTITKTYTVTITKKPITVNVTPQTISYGDDLPTTYDVALAQGSAMVGTESFNDIIKTPLGGKLEAVDSDNRALTATTANAGKYKVAMQTGEGAFTADNYAVTVAENNDGLTINKAAITGFTGLPTPAAVYANNEKNATTAKHSCRHSCRTERAGRGEHPCTGYG